MTWTDTRNCKVRLLQSSLFSGTCVPIDSSHPRHGQKDDFRVETVEIEKNIRRIFPRNGSGTKLK